MSETVKLIRRNGEEKTEYKHEVEGITIFQFAKVLSIFKEIIGLARENQSIAELIDMGFAAFEEKTEGPKKKDEAKEEKFLTDPLEAFQVLLTEVPEKAIGLLSVMSGIDRKTLDQQDALVIFDVYDAVIQTNDIEEIVIRAKKSLDVTRNTFKMKKFIKEKKQA